MIKITGKDIAILINKTEGNTRVILARRKIKIKYGYLEDLIDLIAEYRNKKHKGYKHG